MEQKDLTQEYKTFLEGLEEKPLKEFLEDFKILEENKNISYKDKFSFLNKYSNKEILNILNREEFLKIYYLDGQAKYIFKEVGSIELENIKTLVYCFNCNSREFNKKVEEENLKNRLLKEGYILGNTTTDNKEDLKKLNKLKIKCVFDRDKIGLMGSFTEIGEYEGKFFYDDVKGFLYFLPKRHTRTGQILIGRFYYKEMKGGNKEK